MENNKTLQPATSINNNHSKIFDPHISFLSLPVVRYIGAGMVFLALIVAVIIKFNTDLSFNFSSEGWNQALTTFKVPIGILAIIIPVIALLASNHRSEQTRRQISLTLQQIDLANSQMTMIALNNGFANYYKHVEAFQDYVSEHGKGSQMEIALPRKFHREAFPGAKKADYTVGLIKIDLDDFIFSMLRVISRMTNDEGTRGWISNALNLTKGMEAFQKKYYIKNTALAPLPAGYVHRIADEAIQLPGAQLKNLIIQFIELCLCMHSAMIFDETYTPTEFISKLDKFDTKQLLSNSIEGPMDVVHGYDLAKMLDINISDNRA